MAAYPRDDDWGDYELERRRAKALDRRLDAEDQDAYTGIAQRMLREHGWPGARIENARRRDQSSWGTFSHGWHVQVGKAIERLYQQNPGDYE